MRSVPLSKSTALPSASAAPALLDWAVGIGSLWLISGLYLDGWAHHRIALESFFTPWHAVLYSGFFFTAASVGLAFLSGLRDTKNWRTALPAGYQFSLLGAVLFLIGGVADMTWHTLFGIEQSLEALLSPPHLLLAAGGSMLISGPLRAAVLRARASEDRDVAPGLPALFSIIALWGMIAFFTAYANPWMEGLDRSARGWGFVIEGYNQAGVVSGVLLQSAILSGMMLFLVRNFRLPFGSLTLAIGLVTLASLSQHEVWRAAILGLLGGLIADGLVAALRPGPTREGPTRLFSFLAPFFLYALLFGSLKASGMLNWSFEMWGGAVLLAGFTGWLMSYVSHR